MDFEFDAEKSRANLAKHQIDFETAQGLWYDGARLKVPARTQGEPRWLVIGRIDGKLWSAVVTERHGRTRIISVRRSRGEEKALYEDQA